MIAEGEVSADEGEERELSRNSAYRARGLVRKQAAHKLNGLLARRPVCKQIFNNTARHLVHLELDLWGDTAVDSTSGPGCAQVRKGIPPCNNLLVAERARGHVGDVVAQALLPVLAVDVDEGAQRGHTAAHNEQRVVAADAQEIFQLAISHQRPLGRAQRVQRRLGEVGWRRVRRGVVWASPGRPLRRWSATGRRQWWCWCWCCWLLGGRGLRRRRFAAGRGVGAVWSAMQGLPQRQRCAGVPVVLVLVGQDCALVATAAVCARAKGDGLRIGRCLCQWVTSVAPCAVPLRQLCALVQPPTQRPKVHLHRMFPQRSSPAVTAGRCSPHSRRAGPQPPR